MIIVYADVCNLNDIIYFIYYILSYVKIFLIYNKQFSVFNFAKTKQKIAKIHKKSLGHLMISFMIENYNENDDESLAIGHNAKRYLIY